MFVRVCQVGCSGGILVAYSYLLNVVTGIPSADVAVSVIISFVIYILNVFHFVFTDHIIRRYGAPLCLLSLVPFIFFVGRSFHPLHARIFFVPVAPVLVGSGT